MKKSLGSFLVLLLFCLNLQASEYKWTSYTTKEKAYVGESVYVKYVCEFDDIAQLYIIDFEPTTNELYEVVLLSKDEKLHNGKRINTYEYMLKLKKAQEIELDFQATMKKTSLDSIVENTTNHYDDTKFDSIHEKTIVKMKKIRLNVLDTSKKLLGEFALEVNYDKTNVKAFEPYHLDITLKGQGNFDAMKDIEFSIDNVKIFAQKPIKNIKLDKDGYKGSWTQKFAFVSVEDFSIASQNIEYFDTKEEKMKILKIEQIDVKVHAAYKKSELLDSLEEERMFNPLYLYYILTFIAGFLIGKIKFKTKNIQAKDEKLTRKIQEAKSLDALSMLLILNDEKRFKAMLSMIDSNGVKSLKQAKKLTLKLLA